MLIPLVIHVFSYSLAEVRSLLRSLSSREPSGVMDVLDHSGVYQLPRDGAGLVRQAA